MLLDWDGRKRKRNSKNSKNKNNSNGSDFNINKIKIVRTVGAPTREALRSTRKTGQKYT